MDKGIKFAVAPSAMGHRQNQSFQEFIKIAQTADEMGLDGVYWVDHFFLAPDRMMATTVDLKRPYQLECWTALAALAATTKKVRLGPMVTPISLRHPSFIAKMAANIDVISNGRLVLPVGTGWNEREYTGFSFPYDKPFSVRYQKMVEGVEIIKKFWTEDDWVSYEGQYYKLDRAPFWPKPFQKPHPPIWFGGSGAKTRRAVAKYGDGWTPAAPHYLGVPPEIYRDGLAEIRSMAQAEGRDPNKITPAFLLLTAIAKTRKEALEKCNILRQRVDWKDVPLEELERKGVVIAGSPGDVVEHLQKYVEAGVRYFTFTSVPFDLPDMLKAMELYHKEVIPALTRA